MESEGGSQVNRGDNFPIVKSKAFNIEVKGIQFIQIIQVIAKMMGDKKARVYKIKKAEFSFMLNLKSLNAKSATDAEVNRVTDAMNRR